jgi:hypothetical protein
MPAIDHTPKILQIIRMRGPVIPVQVSKEIGLDIMMSAAVLADMSSRRIVKVSNLKVGGSPLYYLAGQEHKLENFSGRLVEKEKKAYDLLKASGVLRDRALEAVERVALRQIKDFAVPLEVTLNGDKEIFWRWHTLEDDAATLLIRKVLGIEEAVKKIEPVIPVPLISQVAVQEKPPEPVPEPVLPAAEKQQPLTEQPIEPEQIRPLVKQRKPRKPRQDSLSAQTKQTVLEPAPVPEVHDEFMDFAVKYLEKKGIEVISSQVIKRYSESDFVIKVPSNLGKLTYYCKARKKARISEVDLSSVYVQAEMKKLPAMLLITGELTRTAKERLDKEFASISVRQI